MSDNIIIPKNIRQDLDSNVCNTYSVSFDKKKKEKTGVLDENAFIASSISFTLSTKKTQIMQQINNLNNNISFYLKMSNIDATHFYYKLNNMGNSKKKKPMEIYIQSNNPTNKNDKSVNGPLIAKKKPGEKYILSGILQVNICGQPNGAGYIVLEVQKMTIRHNTENQSSVQKTKAFELVFNSQVTGIHG